MYKIRCDWKSHIFQLIIKIVEWNWEILEELLKWRSNITREGDSNCEHDALFERNDSLLYIKLFQTNNRFMVHIPLREGVTAR